MPDNKGAVKMKRESQKKDRRSTCLPDSGYISKNFPHTAIDGICVISDVGKLLEVNSALSKILGYSMEELLEMTVSDFEVDESPEEIIEHLQQIKEHGYGRFETRHRRKDGEIIDVEVSTHFCGFSGEDITFSFFRDITEQKRLRNELREYKEKVLQAEKHAYVDSMGAIVAHQLNQPLTMINMLLGESIEDIESRSPDIKNIRENLQECLSEVKNTTSIIGKFRRHIQNQSIIARVHTDIAEIANRIVSTMSEKAAVAKMRVTLSGMDRLPPVEVGEAALEQIFFVMIQNAIEAAEGKKRHKLAITAKSIDKTVEMVFSDNCCGIEPENIEKIFEPFFTTKSRGMGIGLEIVQRILIICGGSIRTESELDKGTTFYVTLPACDNLNP